MSWVGNGQPIERCTCRMHYTVLAHITIVLYNYAHRAEHAVDKAVSVGKLIASTCRTLSRSLIGFQGRNSY